MSNTCTGDRIQLIPVDAERRVDVLIEGAEFTSYLYPDTIMKPVLDPLRTATGVVVTRGYPLAPRPKERTDHPHHVGLWFNYGNVNGFDFWNNSDAIPEEKRDHFGTIRHREIIKAEGGCEVGTLVTVSEWLTPDDRAMLREQTTFLFSGNETTRTIDRLATLTALEDVSMKDDKEGMLGIRMARELEAPDDNPTMRTMADGSPGEEKYADNEGVNGVYRTSEGIEGDAVWGTRGRWCNLSGKIGGEMAHVAILDHPGNPGYPTYWHARGYGLFAANTLGQSALSDGKDVLDFALAEGESATFRYRILIDSRRTLPDEVLEAECAAFADR